MNWVEYLEEEFRNDDRFDLQSSSNDDELLFKVKVLSSSSDLFIRFEVDKYLHHVLNRAVFSADGVSSFCEGVFNKSKLNNLQFIQKTWFEVEGDDYKLEFGEDSIRKLKAWLEIPLQWGWIEHQYLYHGSFYKVDIILEKFDPSPQMTIYLKSSVEQDIPLGILDQHITFFRKFYIESLRKSKSSQFRKIQISS